MPPPKVVAIAASTGGPAALQRICSSLPSAFEAPLLVVQHMSHGFVEGFAQWLGVTADRPVHVVEDGQAIKPNAIYVAPDDWHFGLDRSWRARLDHGAPINGFRPSGSYLLESVSAAHGAAVLAIVLTGMGEDGASALPALHERGGRVWVQDPKTAVVSGMPDAAIATGTVEQVLAVDRIATALGNLSAEAAAK